MNKILVSIIFFLYTGTAWGQHIIKGSVSSGNKVPLSASTVQLFDRKGLSVKSVRCDEAGRFSMAIDSSGHYYIQASHIGFMDSTIDLTIGIDSISQELIFVLTPSTQMLGTVAVTAGKKLVRKEPGKTVVSIEKSPLSESRNVFALLKNLPGVTVSNSGQIKIKGRSGVTVMIDGEPVEMDDKQLKTYLASIPGNQLKSIEILDRPPASMDAAGSGGVINIVFKKKLRDGFGATLTSGLGMGKYSKNDHGIDLNYGKDKWRFSGAFSYNYNHSWSRDSTFRTTSKDNLPVSVDQLNDNQYFNRGFLGRLEVQRELSDNSDLSAKLVFNSEPGKGAPSGITRFYQKKGTPDSVLWQSGNTLSSMRSEEALLKYTNKLNERSALKVSVRGFFLHNDQNDAIRLTRSQNSQRGNYRLAYPFNHTTWNARGDYSSTLNLFASEAAFEAGIKSSLSNIRNNRRFSFNGNIPQELQTASDSRSQFSEYIQAGYASLSLPLNKWTFKGGLRGEYTGVHGDMSAATTASTRQRYFSLFPDLMIERKISSNYKLSASYNRRIERPELEDLNPLIKVIDPYTSESGNPDLKPQFSNTIELGQQFWGWLTLSLGTVITTDNILPVTIQNKGDLKSRSTYINSGSQYEWYGELSFPIKITDWWDNYYSINVNHSSFTVPGTDVSGRQQNTLLDINWQNTFTLPKDFVFELNGSYMGGSTWGNLKFKPSGEVNAGISKKFLKGAMNAAITVSDIFYTNKWQSTGMVGISDTYRSFSSEETRIVKLSVSWHFGKKAKNAGNPAEEGNVKGEGNSSPQKGPLKKTRPGQ